MFFSATHIVKRLVQDNFEPTEVSKPGLKIHGNPPALASQVLGLKALLGSQIFSILASHFIFIQTIYSEHKSNTFYFPITYQEITISEGKKKEGRKILTLDTVLLQGCQWIQSKFLHLWWKYAI